MKYEDGYFWDIPRMTPNKVKYFHTLNISIVGLIKNVVDNISLIVEKTVCVRVLILW